MDRRDFLTLVSLPLVPMRMRTSPPAVPFFTPRYYEVAVPISLDEINAVLRAELCPQVLDSFFKPDPFFALLQQGRRPSTELHQPCLPGIPWTPPDDEWDEDA